MRKNPRGNLGPHVRVPTDMERHIHTHTHFRTQYQCLLPLLFADLTLFYELLDLVFDNL